MELVHPLSLRTQGHTLGPLEQIVVTGWTSDGMRGDLCGCARHARCGHRPHRKGGAVRPTASAQATASQAPCTPGPRVYRDPKFTRVRGVPGAGVYRGPGYGRDTDVPGSRTLGIHQLYPGPGNACFDMVDLAASHRPRRFLNAPEVGGFRGLHSNGPAMRFQLPILPRASLPRRRPCTAHTSCRPDS